MNSIEHIRIGDAFEVETGSTPSTMVPEYWEGGTIKWITPFDLGKLNSRFISQTSRSITKNGLENSSTTLVPAGSVIISTRAPIGYLAVLTEPMAFNQGCKALLPKVGREFEPLYIYYQLQTKVQEMNRLGSGSTFKEISKEKLESIRIHLPPLATQKQIADILEKADAAREKRRQANKLTEQFLQSAFLEMFGDPLRSSIVRKRVRVGDILENYQYGLSVALSGDSSPSDGLPILRIANITGQGYVDYSDLKYFKVGKKREETLRLKKGDLLFNWRNSPKWVGKTAIFNAEGNFIFASFLLRLRIREEIVNKVFFWYWVNYLRAKGVFESKCRQAVNQASFNGFDLERIEIICPPLSQQQRFATLVEKVESLRAKQRESEKELENLFQSLMQRAFRGELVS